MEDSESIAISGDCGVFTTEEAVEAFNALKLDEKACRMWVLNRLHQSGAHCPQCKADIQEAETFWDLGRCRCKACGKWFTATTGTILQGVQLRPDELYLLAVLSGLGVEIKEVARIVRVQPDTVRLWQGKFKIMGGGDHGKENY